jgi:hypothetical protein
LSAITVRVAVVTIFGPIGALLASRRFINRKALSAKVCLLRDHQKDALVRVLTGWHQPNCFEEAKIENLEVSEG